MFMCHNFLFRMNLLIVYVVFDKYSEKKKYDFYF